MNNFDIITRDQGYFKGKIFIIFNRYQVTIRSHFESVNLFFLIFKSRISFSTNILISLYSFHQNETIIQKKILFISYLITYRYFSSIARNGSKEKRDTDVSWPMATTILYLSRKEELICLAIIWCKIIIYLISDSVLFYHLVRLSTHWCGIVRLIHCFSFLFYCRQRKCNVISNAY